jgi:hypothetical protein
LGLIDLLFGRSLPSVSAGLHLVILRLEAPDEMIVQRRSVCSKL